jgi:hypothetical protein
MFSDNRLNGSKHHPNSIRLCFISCQNIFSLLFIQRLRHWFPQYGGVAYLRYYIRVSQEGLIKATNNINQESDMCGLGGIKCAY